MRGQRDIDHVVNIGPFRVVIHLLRGLRRRCHECERVWKVLERPLRMQALVLQPPHIAWVSQQRLHRLLNL